MFMIESAKVDGRFFWSHSAVRWWFWLMFFLCGLCHGKLEMHSPHFSTPRCVFEHDFQLVLSSWDPEVSILYTTDGVDPEKRGGMVGEEGSPVVLSIDRTMIVKARSVREGEMSDVVTHTYVKVGEVLKQVRPGEVPDRVDVEMDADFLGGEGVREKVSRALLSAPAISIVMDEASLFGKRGLYLKRSGRGVEWERECSFEWIPGGKKRGAGVRCGLRLQGESVRMVSPKLNFQFRFRKKYGVGKLRARLFEDGEVRRFDSLILRSPTQDSWAINDEKMRKEAMYVKDRWVSESQRAMGHLAPRHRWVHLFLNGMYWGVYDLCERPDEHFASSWLGGEDEDYVVYNEARLVSGGGKGRSRMRRWLRHSKMEQEEVWQRVEELVDVDCFIDHTLLNFYAGNCDWGVRNYRLIGNAGEKPRFRFVSWDAEMTFWKRWPKEVGQVKGSALDYCVFRTPIFGRREESVGFYWQRFLKNEEFRKRYGRRVAELFGEGGLLSKEKASEGYRRLIDEVEPLLWAEAARWGDANGMKRMSPGSKKWKELTGEESWIFGEFFEGREEVLKKQLESVGMGGLRPSLE